MGKAEKIKEAVARMKKLGIIEDAIKQFEDSGAVMCSISPNGFLYCLTDEQRKIADDFEREYNAMVYLAVYSNTSIGEMISYLYISDHPEEWESDMEDIGDGFALTYTYNFDAPDCSEVGSIGIGAVNGGLARTC